jgi:hypothetical protein
VPPAPGDRLEWLGSGVETSGHRSRSDRRGPVSTARLTSLALGGTRLRRRLAARRKGPRAWCRLRAHSRSARLLRSVTSRRLRAPRRGRHPLRT